jgi:hypothetical protein
MVCVLRVGGNELDVDGLLAGLPIKPCAVFRKGEPRAANTPDSRVNERSAANFQVSGDDFAEFGQQIDDALRFLEKSKSLFERLRAFPGVQYCVLDFGVEIREPFWCCFEFPSPLLAAAGALGLSLALSTYPVLEGEP